MSANVQLPRAIARKPKQLDSPTESKSPTSNGSRNSSNSDSSSFTSVEDFNAAKIPTHICGHTSPMKNKLKNIQSIHQAVPPTPLSRIPRPSCHLHKKVVLEEDLQARKLKSSVKRAVPVPVTCPHRNLNANPTADEHKPISKSKPIKPVSDMENAKKEATQVVVKQMQATETKPLTKGEQLKLAFAKGGAEKEATRAAKRAQMPFALPTAEEMQAQIKLETAARIKQRNEERDRVAQEEKAKKEAAKSVVLSEQSTSVGSANPPLTNSELIILRMANDAKKNEEERTVREADREALRRRCVDSIENATWSPPTSPAKRCERRIQPAISPQATPEGIRSEDYLPRGLPRSLQSAIQVQGPPEEIRSEDYLPRGLPRPIPSISQLQAAPEEVRGEGYLLTDVPGPIQPATPKTTIVTRKRSSCTISMPVPRQKKVVFELECSGDDESDESPDPTCITIPEFPNSDEPNKSPLPPFVAHSESTGSPVLLSHVEQVQEKDVEAERAQILADLKTRVQIELDICKAQQRKRFGWVDKVIPPRTRQIFPPIVTGFENLGIYVPDPRNGTPDRCATSWGNYLTYPLDNVNMDLHRAKHQEIQRCLTYFAEANKIRIKKLRFKHEYLHVPFEHHRAFKHDQLCIANTEGPVYDHQRTMSYRNSRFKHEPENCWNCHLATVPEVKTIWEEEDELQEEVYEEEESCMIELYDEDGFLIEENVCGFEDGYEREEDFYDGEVGVYQNNVHSEDEKSFEIGNIFDAEGCGINEQAAAPAHVQEVLEVVECLEAETTPRMIEENQLLQVKERSPTQLIALKANTKHSQAINISKIQPALLVHIKSLSPSILARTAKVFHTVFNSIILTNSIDTTIKLPLQRYFSDLFIVLTRSHNCARIFSYKYTTFFRVAAPSTLLVLSSITSATSITMPSLTIGSANAEGNSAIKLLTQFSRENGITRGPVNVIKSWLLDMPPCKQVVACVQEVGNVMRRIFGYATGENA
ncbi:uncharacterized protein LAJ45_08845 [Morchella importuna]|uniref:uncharacterized protein n=1 Tax=Morchella importuna TaxID=1174673 RepID=UPI001E8D5A80|nr:uncharacterized protein LAJ45_08845 [Morchella importuna]KAH8147046.1 hypothetical protein LAJ45_08845 [Morchella importuna]